LLDWLNLSRDLSPLLAATAIVVGVVWESAVFYLLFTLLARPRLTRRALWSGALLGALGFELLKWLSTYLLRLTSHQPAVMAFGVTLILLVWINYFSRIALFAASWAHTPRFDAVRR
jgi:membrane protein